MTDLFPYFKLTPGGGGHTPQTKEVEITENGQLVINADEGYDCLSSVTANVNVPSSGEDGGALKMMDFDGTILYSFTREEVMEMTELPEPPDHSDNEVPLTFDEWNWTLEEVKEYLSSIDHYSVLVGAIYHPTDGYHHVFAKLKNALTVEVSNNGSVDWGDGTTSTSGGAKSHTYSNEGEYHIVIDGKCLRIGSTGNDTYKAIQYDRAYISTNIDSGFHLKNCHDLRFITLPYTFTWGTGNPVTGNSCMASLICPRGVLILTMSSCFGLKSISLPYGVVSVSISYCPNLEYVQLANVENLSISSCGLRKVNLPDSLISLGSSAFSYSRNLEEINIPSSVTSIGANAFYECGRLSIVNMENGLVSIGNQAFYYCKALKKITIPNSVTSIGTSLFASCESLREVILSDNIEVIPSNILSGLQNITKVVIGSGTKEIGYGMLSGLRGYTLVFRSAVPPTISSSSSISSPFKIVVPKGSIDAYKNATNLSQMASIMVEADE